MIIDKFTNAHFYYGLNERLEKAIDYLKSNNIENFRPGKYEIAGDDLFFYVFEYDTKDIKDCLWECHKKYLDFHYIVKGKETMGYSNIKDMEQTKEYDEAGDYTLYQGVGDLLKLNEGTFAIFTPNDVHITSIKVDKEENVKKIVLKLLVD